MGKAALSLAFAAALCAADSSRQPVTATDLLKLHRITELQIAPDGSFAVYVLQSIHTGKDAKGDPEYAYRTHLWRVNFHDSAPLQLTFGDRRDQSLSLSPDGKTAAFVRPVAQDGGKAKPQVWLLPLDRPGEARQLTHFEHGAQAPSWHPDGRSLLLSSPVPITRIEGKPHYAIERPGREWFDWNRSNSSASPDGGPALLRDWLEGNAGRANPTVVHRLAFQDEQSLKTEPTVNQLFAVDAASGAATPVTRDFYSHSHYSYSPDGSRIVSISTPKSTAHPDRLRRNAVWVISAAGADPRPVLDDPAENPTAVRWYPDNSSLLVTTQPFDEPAFRQSRLARLDLAADRLVPLAEGWDSSIASAAPDSGDSVLFTSSRAGGTPLLRLSGERITEVVAGPVGVSDFDEAAGRIVYAQISAANPNEWH